MKISHTEVASVLYLKRPVVSRHPATPRARTIQVAAYEYWVGMVNDFAQKFAEQIPGFDKNNFARQCGLDPVSGGAINPYNKSEEL